MVDRCFPANAPPDALEREAAEHEAYAHGRTAVYVADEALYRSLDAHAAGNGTQPLLVLGESGSGKSALLANWVARYRAANSNAVVIQHFVGATRSSADSQAMLLRLMGELKRLLNIPRELPQQPGTVADEFPTWLAAAASVGRVVLVLDELNQLEDRDGAPDLVWLPASLPPDVRVVVSTFAGRPLDALKRRGCDELHVTGLREDERRQIIVQYLGRYAKSIAASLADRIIAAPQTHNPLYLRVLLDEMRVHGQHETLADRLNYYLGAADLPSLLDRVLARFELDYEADAPDLVSRAASSIWAARRGLTEAELLDLAARNGETRLPQAVWAPLHLAAEGFLIERSGLIAFAHDHIREAVRRRYLPTGAHQETAHARLAAYFIGAGGQFTGGWRELDELPWQLARCRQWDLLASLLADKGFLAGAWRHAPLEVKTYWAQVERASDIRLTDAYAAQVHDPDGEPDTQFLWTVCCLLRDVGRLREALSIGRSLAARCRASGDIRLLERVVAHNGLALHALGDDDEALSAYAEQERLAYASGNDISLSDALANRALVLRGRDQLDVAMDLLKRQEEICRRSGRLDGVQGSLGNQALILRRQGRREAAMQLLHEQQQLCKRFGDLSALANCLGNQANILFDQRDVSGAMALSVEQEQIYRQLNERAGLATCLGNRALMMEARRELDTAEQLLLQQERLCCELGTTRELGVCLYNRARIRDARGDWEAALQMYGEAAALFRRTGDRGRFAHAESNRQALAERMRDRKVEDGDGSAEVHMNDGRLHPDFVLGESLSKKGDLAGARIAYRRAAEDGSAVAQHNLGALLAEGRGGPQDLRQAATWFRKAANQGIAASQANLGLQYAEGSGVEKDHAAAMKWLRKAADQGFAEGEYSVGVMYLQGYGVKPDAVEGYKWIERAASHGHALAKRVKGDVARRAVLQEADAHGANVTVLGGGGGHTARDDATRPDEPTTFSGVLLAPFVGGIGGFIFTNIALLGINYIPGVDIDHDLGLKIAIAGGAVGLVFLTAVIWTDYFQNPRKR